MPAIFNFKQGHCLQSWSLGPDQGGPWKRVVPHATCQSVICSTTEQSKQRATRPVIIKKGILEYVMYALSLLNPIFVLYRTIPLNEYGLK